MEDQQCHFFPVDIVLLSKDEWTTAARPPQPCSNQGFNAEARAAKRT